MIMPVGICFSNGDTFDKANNFVNRVLKINDATTEMDMDYLCSMGTPLVPQTFDIKIS